MAQIADIIKYEGDNSTFIWKHPCEDFNSLTQLIVHESQEAIFFMNGQALDLFGAGRYLHSMIMRVVTADRGLDMDLFSDLSADWLSKLRDKNGEQLSISRLKDEILRLNRESVAGKVESINMGDFTLGVLDFNLGKVDFLAVSLDVSE